MTEREYIRLLDEAVEGTGTVYATAVNGGWLEIQLTVHVGRVAPYYAIRSVELATGNEEVHDRSRSYDDLFLTWLEATGGEVLPRGYVNTRWLWSRHKAEKALLDFLDDLREREV